MMKTNNAVEPVADDDRLMNSKEVIETVFSRGARPSIPTFHAWRDLGLIPHMCIGRRYYYSAKAVRQALEGMGLAAVEPGPDKAARAAEFIRQVRDAKRKKAS